MYCKSRTHFKERNWFNWVLRQRYSVPLCSQILPYIRLITAITVQSLYLTALRNNVPTLFRDLLRMGSMYMGDNKLGNADMCTSFTK